MINTLQRLAIAIQMLRLPFIILGWVCLASLAATIFILAPHQGDRFIIPSLLGLLWAMSTYAFIVAFRSVPEKPDKTSTIFIRSVYKIRRAWYGFIGVVFIGTTVVMTGLTCRLVAIWLREYGR